MKILLLIFCCIFAACLGIDTYTTAKPGIHELCITHNDGSVESIIYEQMAGYPPRLNAIGELVVYYPDYMYHYPKPQIVAINVYTFTTTQQP